ncbi:hypothetical protein Gbro_2416 [Gordonia bronchialis DSM 43247]|uniref:Uncharacterized protein n=1 Tax=Gordonia bronchialis (strain ATCC 25592 / DSM 43247 / BCRC 13721 / JCM 3198 / KCTC 3076 / NBRC 16047 / NCTC 10667) TaxID=526226 RepID=D0LDN5_GORB4|nr:hypothetical protein [Gordonia bronchialis]ACY21658.1 hypothetical protein Gbro_2416 [Gordonia bronchialis DSM 43247]MCC3324446.1 hypothetical protein [Gordonia bronchialis]QGS24715.1 hypothetical protein FOB84_11705 [Gordonia bronchialis]UAK39036.1 hypothetical protein K8O93_04665 [Gordonia bronchialis]STQ64545.1 Uncharacterised protein [Gordonia bronchialis]
MIIVAIILLAVAAVLAPAVAVARPRMPGWTDHPVRVDIATSAVLLVLVGLAALLAAASGCATGAGGVIARVVAALAAVTGGSPIVRGVLAGGGVVTRNDDTEPGTAPHGDPDAAGPLRGGRVIGHLERLAVAATLLAGWPEGLAIILAVKSLARYPELRAPHASEQFIMGTFASVLWAVGAVGAGTLIIT